jgi:hypothetical protein
MPTSSTPVDLTQLADLPRVIQHLQERVQKLEVRLTVAERRPLIVAEAARALEVHPRTVRRMCARGELQQPRGLVRVHAPHVRLPLRDDGRYHREVVPHHMPRHVDITEKHCVHRRPGYYTLSTRNCLTVDFEAETVLSASKFASKGAQARARKRAKAA